MKRTFAGLAGSLLMLTAAEAATVAAIEGGATVNAGNGFMPLAIGAKLQPGDRVMANPDGSVTLKYVTGVTSTIKAGQIFTVPVFPPGSTPLAAVAPPPPPPPPPLISPALLSTVTTVATVGGSVAAVTVVVQQQQQLIELQEELDELNDDDDDVDNGNPSP